MNRVSFSAVASGIAGTIFLYMAGPASGITIVKPILGGPFSTAFGFDLGTIAAIKLNSQNTYDFTFVIGSGGNVLTQIQASVSEFPAVSEPIEFDLYSGLTTGGAYITTTPYAVGPSLTELLSPGDYYLQVIPAYIAADDELLTGGLADLPVPEQASWVLMLVGLGGLGIAMRARRRRAVLALA